MGQNYAQSEGIMSRRLFRLLCVAAGAFAALVLTPSWALGQTGQGTITVTVIDSAGGALPGAQLRLQDLATNDIRTATTGDQGTYSFVNLSIGTYGLTVSKDGFQRQQYESITVHAVETTDIKASLRVGGVAQTVEISGDVTPLIETTSNAISDNIDMKQLEDLPIQGRNVGQLSSLVPGYNGTWNGLPSAAQSNSIDGISGSESRRKFMGNSQPLNQARLEDIAEMTVQTSQLDLDQGFGQADMQVSFVTRSGTNNFHGRAYEDFQNAWLNANSWYNDATGLPKAHLILNDFGGSLGGPIIKNRLFFFGSFAMSKQPGSVNGSNTILTSAAQAGLFTFTGTDGQTHSINLFTQVAQPNGLPSTVNSVTAQQQSAISAGLQGGTVRPSADPNINTVSWLAPSPVTMYFPTVRVDYNLSQKIRLDFAFNETKNLQPTAALPLFPGSNFHDQTAGNKLIDYTASIGFSWTLSPSLINQFRGGWLYAFQDYAYNAAPIWTTEPAVTWSLTSSGQGFPNLPTSNFYPTITATDSMNWQHAAHTISFGVSFFREQDHYWNPVSGFATFKLGLTNGDPALNAFSTSPLFATATQSQLAEAENMYAQLAGRISSVSGSHPLNKTSGQYSTGYGSFNLDELQQAWGLFFQDSYRARPDLTVNYGLRWDFTGDDHDLTSAYHSLDQASVWGPSGINNSFQPGVLPGTMNPEFTARGHQYAPWNVSPQPAIGIAWNPQNAAGFMGKLLGPAGDTVIRTGYSLRRYTEPYQYFWDAASSYGAFFNQSFYLNSNTSGQPGTFTPGSLSLGGTVPAYGVTPTTYPTNYPLSGTTFVNPYESNSPLAATGFDPHIHQPYIQSWNFGLQRQLTNKSALEVRYIGSRTIHQWISLNTNEVNIFENGFLQQFKQAQTNLALNTAGGNPNSFANNGHGGQAATPIFDQAFRNVPASEGYSDGAFIQQLRTGQAGGLAASLAGGQGGGYFCNLVPTSFVPCGPGGTAGYRGAGGTYPINYFQANPFVSGQEIGYMTSAGYSNYNGLQVDFRQKAWRGLQFDANYTWSHTLGVSSPPTQWTGQVNQFTLRNLAKSYGPSPYDTRHSIHANGTYDLPVGRGRRLLNQGGIVNGVFGGWTVGSILTYQSGVPFQLFGGYYTFNDYGDGGIGLNGVSVAQIQKSMGAYRVANSPFVDIVNPKYLVSATGGGANPNYIAANASAGTLGQNPYLYGPHYFDEDIAISKIFPIRENISSKFQAEMLNAFNHPNFGTNFTNPETEGLVNGLNNSITSVENNSFGTITGPTTGARVIELRLSVQF